MAGFPPSWSPSGGSGIPSGLCTSVCRAESSEPCPPTRLVCSGEDGTRWSTKRCCEMVQGQDGGWYQVFPCLSPEPTPSSFCAHLSAPSPNIRKRVKRASETAPTFDPGFIFLRSPFLSIFKSSNLDPGKKPLLPWL